MGCLTKALIGIIGALVIMIASAMFFPVPPPHVHLPAEEVFSLAGFSITNTLLASWLTLVVLVVMFWLGTRKMKLVPAGWQNVIEWIYESLYNFIEEPAGKENARRFFPLVATIFLWVIMAAFISLLPGFDTIGFGETEEISGAFVGQATGFVVHTPFLRKANTSINFPLSLALIAFISWSVWAIKLIGVREYSKQFFKFGGIIEGLKELFKGKIKPGFSAIFTGAVEIFAGLLELLSRIIQIISLTFRLFGNMLAGAILLLLVPHLLPWLVDVPVYGLEMLFGFCQALIFAGLTLSFLIIATTPAEEH